MIGFRENVTNSGECQDSCRMKLYPFTTSAVADRASFKYTVVVRDQLRLVPRQRSGRCERAAW
jgi:predicted lipoprotein with Yx(FWY)xxD motif